MLTNSEVYKLVDGFINESINRIDEVKKSYIGFGLSEEEQIEQLAEMISRVIRIYNQKWNQLAEVEKSMPIDYYLMILHTTLNPVIQEDIHSNIATVLIKALALAIVNAKKEI